MTLPRCDCGAPAMAWRPGTEPPRCPDLFDAPLTPGDLPAAWCFDHWPFRQQATSNPLMNGGTNG